MLKSPTGEERRRPRSLGIRITSTLNNFVSLFHQCRIPGRARACFPNQKMLFKSPIPAEIFEEIVSYLHDDEAALKQCALVSSWTLPSCQRHLFKTIDLKFVSARIYDQFTQVFTNRPHLSNYVRSLELDIRAPSKHDSLRFKFKKALPEDDDSFHCVLRSFTSLSKIWLNIAIPRGQSIHFKLTQVVHHLLSLHTLHTVTFECGWLPTSFLDQFTHIRNLNLFDLSVEDAVPSADEKLPPSRIASPTSLILLNPNEDFLGPLAKFASHPNTSLDFSLLQYIAVQDQDPDDSPLPHARLADIIRMSSKSLKHFSWFSFSSKEHLPSYTPLPPTDETLTSLYIAPVSGEPGPSFYR